MKLIFPVASFIPSLGILAMAGDYASQIIAYRHAHGLISVRLDSRSKWVALQQACEALSGTVSHTVGGGFSSRVAGLSKSKAAENIAAGFVSFAGRKLTCAGNDEGLVRPAPSAAFKRQVSIDKRNRQCCRRCVVGCNRWEVVQKGSQENAFVTLGHVGSRLLYEIAVYEFKIGRDKPLIIAVRPHRGLFSAFSGICQ
jgi:hypothetical protein